MVCRSCNKDWDEVGIQYDREDGSRLDYLCSKRKGGCGSRLMPLDVGKRLEDNCQGLKIEPTIKEPMKLNGFALIEQMEKERSVNINRVIEDHRVLVIPDLHAPFMHKNTIPFLKSIYEKYDCNEVVCLGDEIDYHRSSFHTSDPDAFGATEELRLATKQLGELAEVFPAMKVCSGNHSQIPKRQAYAIGLSGSLIKENKDILLEFGAHVEGWEFGDHFIIDGVKYTHGTGRQAKQRMLQDGISVVQGHYHSKTYLEYLANDYQLNFAMQLGSLIDDEAYCFNYGKHFAKSHKNCGVVINGVPTIEYMEL